MQTAIIKNPPDQYTTMLENYASIVEKTNNQLGLSLNMSSLAVAILSAFIAILAIGVAYYIWKNSKEQKDLFKNFLLENKNNINEQNNILMEQKKLELEKVIKEFEKVKDSVTETKKVELQKVIDDLKKEQSSIIFTRQPSSIFYDNNDTGSFYSPTAIMTSQNNSIHSMFCSECGKTFKYYEKVRDPYALMTNDYIGTASIYGRNNKKVHCSYCNAVNIPK